MCFFVCSGSMWFLSLNLVELLESGGSEAADGGAVFDGDVVFGGGALFDEILVEYSK